MDLAPRRLTDDQQSRRAGYLQNRPSSERQIGRAGPAGTHLPQQTLH
jgi:hypothetical protein